MRELLYIFFLKFKPCEGRNMLHIISCNCRHLTLPIVVLNYIVSC